VNGKNLSVRISLPTEAQHPEEKFVFAAERAANPDAAAIGTELDPKVENKVEIQVQIEEHWIELSDGRMRYLKAGAGPALILIHGLMGYSFSWRFAIPALASHATVYAIDNLGAGLSTAADDMDCSVRATAERVLEFAQALNIAEFDLLGTSHGGGVAIMVAAVCVERQSERSSERRADRTAPKNGSRLRRLILVAPVNPWSRHGKWLAPFVGSPFGSLLFRNTLERWRSLDHLWLRRMFGDKSRIPPDSLDGYRVPVLKNQGLRHGAKIVKNWTADLAEIEKALPKIRDYPTLLIWGTKDRAVDFESAQWLRGNFDNIRLVTFEGVGHLPYEEAPAQFNQALIDFLASASSSLINGPD
jgi:pimeloyl-ACP methyl ester carboxylesterase